jgi:hypothetical protein
LKKNSYQIKKIIIALISLAAFILLQNKIQNNISKIYSDESYTIEMAFKSISGENYSSLRVGETTRWVAKLVYPYAIYFMNKNMGGEHYVTTWNYSGKDYLDRNYTNIYSFFENPDPNIQDFWLAMRISFCFLTILSFFITGQLILKKENFFTAMSFLTFSMFSFLLIENLCVFYTESAMIMAINLIICYYYLEIKNVYRSLFLAAFLIVFAVNIKLTGIFLIIPILYIAHEKKYKINTHYFYETMFLFIVGVFYLFTINISDNWKYLNEQFSNIYHYSTGHLISQPSGFYQLKSIVRELSPFIFIFPLIFAVYLIKIKEKKKQYLSYIFVLLAFFLILQLTGAKIFVKRNLVTVFILILFPASIFLGAIFKSFKNKLVKYCSILLLFVFIAVQFSLNFNIINETVLFKELIGVEKYAFVDLKPENFSAGKQIESMPEEYLLKEDLPKIESQFNDYDYVLVNRIKNNKQYTNFILPRKFNLINRKGPYFLFKRKK